MIDTLIRYIQEVTGLNYYNAEDVAYKIMDAVDDLIEKAVED